MALNAYRKWNIVNSVWLSSVVASAPRPSDCQNGAELIETTLRCLRWNGVMWSLVAIKNVLVGDGIDVCSSSLSSTCSFLWLLLLCIVIYIWVLFRFLSHFYLGQIDVGMRHARATLAPVLCAVPFTITSKGKFKSMIGEPNSNNNNNKWIKEMRKTQNFHMLAALAQRELFQSSESFECVIRVTFFALWLWFLLLAFGHTPKQTKLHATRRAQLHIFRSIASSRERNCIRKSFAFLFIRRLWLFFRSNGIWDDDTDIIGYRMEWVEPEAVVRQNINSKRCTLAAHFHEKNVWIPINFRKKCALTWLTNWELIPASRPRTNEQTIFIRYNFHIVDWYESHVPSIKVKLRQQCLIHLDGLSQLNCNPNSEFPYRTRQPGAFDNLQNNVCMHLAKDFSWYSLAIHACKTRRVQSKYSAPAQSFVRFSIKSKFELERKQKAKQNRSKNGKLARIQHAFVDFPDCIRMHRYTLFPSSSSMHKATQQTHSARTALTHTRARARHVIHFHSKIFFYAKYRFCSRVPLHALDFCYYCVFFPDSGFVLAFSIQLFQLEHCVAFSLRQHVCLQSSCVCVQHQ